MHIPQLYALLLQHSTVQTSGLGWSLHSIFKSISGQISIWNTKPAIWDDHDQHSDFLGYILQNQQTLK